MELLRSARQDIVAFLRSDICRKFFHSEDTNVRKMARRGWALITIMVILDVILFSTLTLISNRANDEFEHKQLGFELILYIGCVIVLLFGFFANDLSQFYQRRKYIMEWQQVLTCHYLDTVPNVIGTVEQIGQRLVNSLGSLMPLVVIEIYVPILYGFAMLFGFIPVLFKSDKHFALSFPGMLLCMIIFWSTVQNLIAFWIGMRLRNMQQTRQSLEGEFLSWLQDGESGVRRVTPAYTRGLKRLVKGPMRQVRLKIIHRETLLKGWSLLNNQISQALLYAFMVFTFHHWMQGNLSALVMVTSAIGATRASFTAGADVTARIMEAGAALARLAEIEKAAEMTHIRNSWQADAAE